MDSVWMKNYLEVINEANITDKHFIWVDFSWLNFSWKNFCDCKFEKCNLSNIKVEEATFNGINFINSKLMWIKFNELKKLLLNFSLLDCNINLCCFNWLNLKNMSFEGSNVLESDFYNTKLEWVNFTYCNMKESILENTNLKKTNFNWAINISIDPNTNYLNKTEFSRDNVVWLLETLDIVIN